ncbi:hypothetical protein [Spartinivicinus ruber]|uniref:hypothetical protein n=1 Tax=Spartinivicinus ruber TaxID=2683272 RepID=UPI0013D1A867|nr:hypothetical protein [Spartinivicinus ruber]
MLKAVFMEGWLQYLFLRKAGFVIVICCLLVWWRSSSSEEQIPEDDFLSKLAGNWYGEALHTPVGPRPYTISFKPISSKCISGVANNGVSLHTWTFCQKNNNGLTLTFLSDFAGNHTPIYFKVIKINKEQIIFKADSHPFMEVSFERFGYSRRINIIHYGKLHVGILLKRADVNTP